MKHLSTYLRLINDPDRLSADVKAVRAYVDAFRSFLDMEKQQPPTEIPKDVPKGLLAKLKKVDWSKFSAEVRGWVKDISELSIKIFS